MRSQPAIFDIEQQDETLIVSPLIDLGEAKFREIDDEANGILKRLEDPAIKNVILDFAQTDSFGSSALAFFVRLWKHVCTNKQKMAFCNLSEHEIEILQITKLANLWPVCNSREEALRAVKSGTSF